MGVIDPQGVASLDSRGLIGRPMLWSTRCCYILKYLVSEKKIFKVSPKISLWKLLIHKMWPVLTQGLDW